MHDRDFVAEAAFVSGMGAPRFTHAILNPPLRENRDHFHASALSAHRGPRDRQPL